MSLQPRAHSGPIHTPETFPMTLKTRLSLTTLAVLMSAAGAASTTAAAASAATS